MKMPLKQDKGSVFVNAENLDKFLEHKLVGENKLMAKLEQREAASSALGK